jgi:pyruvate/2-oxoglutarate dehydrogenase complex dihydrolipoamide acyltransferase (E2) component
MRVLNNIYFREVTKLRKEVIMPKIGLDMDEGIISAWLKKVGDKVKAGETIVEIETDKTVTSVESAISGTLVEITAKEGDLVGITKTIAWIETDE